MCASDARAQCVHLCKTGRSFRVTFHCCVFFLCILQKTWLGFTWLNMNSSSCYLSTGYEVWSSSWHNIKCIPFLTQGEVQRPKVAYSFYPCKTLFHLRRSYDTMISLSKSFYKPLPIVLRYSFHIFTLTFLEWCFDPWDVIVMRHITSVPSWTPSTSPVP